MSARRIERSFIPLGGWRMKAACTARVKELLWDDKVDGETKEQRRKRHEEAKVVCNTQCPVRSQCSDEVDWKTDEGIRGGHKIPSLEDHRTRVEAETLRLLRKGYTLDSASVLALLAG